MDECYKKAAEVARANPKDWSNEKKYHIKAISIAEASFGKNSEEYLDAVCECSIKEYSHLFDLCEIWAGFAEEDPTGPVNQPGHYRFATDEGLVLLYAAGLQCEDVLRSLLKADATGGVVGHRRDVILEELARILESRGDEIEAEEMRSRKSDEKIVGKVPVAASYPCAQRALVSLHLAHKNWTVKRVDDHLVILCAAINGSGVKQEVVCEINEVFAKSDARGQILERMHASFTVAEVSFGELMAVPKEVLGIERRGDYEKLRQCMRRFCAIVEILAKREGKVLDREASQALVSSWRGYDTMSRHFSAFYLASNSLDAILSYARSLTIAPPTG